jgi:hypothetical protein
MPSCSFRGHPLGEPAHGTLEEALSSLSLQVPPKGGRIRHCGEALPRTLWEPGSQAHRLTGSRAHGLEQGQVLHVVPSPLPPFPPTVWPVGGAVQQPGRAKVGRESSRVESSRCLGLEGQGLSWCGYTAQHTSWDPWATKGHPR